MGHVLQLLTHSRVKRRMAIAMDGTPPGGHPVDQLATVGETQANAFRGDDWE
jgi:hypothetical protein